MVNKIITGLIVVILSLSYYACTPIIEFTPEAPEEPETEVKDDETGNNNQDDNQEEDKNEDEGEEEKDNPNTDDPADDPNNNDPTDEPIGDDPTAEPGDDDNSDDRGEDIGGSGDVQDPNANYDITPWSGAWASDGGMDVVGSDADLFWEANTFSNRVVVTFNGTTATVESSNSTIKSNISGAYVTIDMQSNSVSGVEIIALGNSSEGGLKIYGDKKFKLTLSGLDLTSKRGPAINSQCKKRMFLHLTDGTTNRITDIASYSDDAYTLPGSYDEDRKGALFSEGHIIVSGKGALVAEGKYKHAIATDGYYYQRPGVTVAVSAAAKNALHVKGDDEDQIGAWFKGGMFYARVASVAGKGVKCDYDIVIDGGKFDIETSGNAEYDTTEADTSSAAGIKSDTHIEINGGNLVFKSTGSGGKGINCDGSLTINGGDLNLTTTGKRYEYNRNTTSSSKAIKVDGAIIINGGKIDINVTGQSEGSEGMESKSTITFNGGETMVKSYDDGINAKSDITINGGKIYTYGTNNDGMDSNGTITMKGGLVIGVGSNAPETGIDVDNSSNWKINGGTMIGFGGSMMASPSSASGQCMLVYNGLSVTAGQEVTLLDSSNNVIVSFEYPLTKSGATLLLSCPEIVKNNTYKVWQGGTISNPTDEWLYWSIEGSMSGGSELSTFTPSSTITTIGSSSGGGPGGGGGGGWPGGGGGWPGGGW